jgi:beta-glucosidase
MRVFCSLIALLPLLLPGVATAQGPPLDANTERRVADLLSKMTLAEKLGQMSQTSFGGPMPAAFREQLRVGRWGSLFNIASREVKSEAQLLARSSRLGIPLIYGADVIHGYQTVVPIPLGQAASWDPTLVQEAARAAAREAAAEGVHWTFAPMLDIARDPRWGRIAESPGEDPYLVGAMGVAMVRGFQGEGLGTPSSVAACGKHYVGYGAAEGGRDYNTTWIPENLLREVYLPPSARLARRARPRS